MRSTRGRAQDEMISHVAATRRPLWILLVVDDLGRNLKRNKGREDQEGPIRDPTLNPIPGQKRQPVRCCCCCLACCFFGVELWSALFVIYAIIMHWVNSHSRPLFHPLLAFLVGCFCGFSARSAKRSIQFGCYYCQMGYIEFRTEFSE